MSKDGIIQQDDRNHVKSVGRAASLLIALAQEGRELSLTELSNKTGLHVSTAHRLLATLMVYHLVEQNQVTGKYRLGLEALHLGTAVLQQLDLRQEVLPFMRELSKLTGETANLSILDGNEVVYVEKVEGSSPLRLFSRIGHRAPAYCTGAGKVLLSEMSLDDVRTILRSQGMVPLTPNTLTTFEEFLLALEFVRLHGYAFDDEECEIGASCIAVPIRGHKGKIVAALSISGASVRFGPARRSQLVQMMVETSRNASVRLGFREDGFAGTPAGLS
ncbi:MAG: IclR family transcriptional regulator [Firmicutes bacterium]|nr:IclR family transcriptional regulator [Bacillota bacterium]